ncbi:hypothetical protein [Microlunatus parietis]|uniref:Uncharacterized protein n=1 Tax=Microlunatus parietis TaxID=682979 RepID=A0A7Y9I6H5_9ACTN|nr:hypothetical protein [Microlunatus parietis]NYE70896.1 hypothetical protein [Microlunatus parietis]
MATLPRRATAIAVAVALVGCAATLLMLVRADRVPPLNFLHIVDHPDVEHGELRVTVAESDGTELIIYGAEVGPVPTSCRMRWVYDVPLERVPASAPSQDHLGSRWRPLWRTTVPGPGGGQEIFTSCTFDAQPVGGGNYFVGPPELPRDDPEAWRVAAVVTGAATLLWVFAAAVVLVRRSA